MVLSKLGAPAVLEAAFVAGFTAMVIFMCINLIWKISIHSGFVAASATILIFLYGAGGVVTTAALPLIAWARIKLKYHSLPQVAAGALLAALIVAVVFYLFGLIGSPIHV